MPFLLHSARCQNRDSTRRFAAALTGRTTPKNAVANAVRPASLPDVCGLSLSDQRKVPGSRQVALLETQLVQEAK
ncbi:hypothetical protein AV530_018184 [Patagioenas fasciata monilis]|uniref:Uncharacterized protein n=1 Tax=Patagioenas fasciata monilis TaxID=372326 RepID=A0A1V4KL69_PATFA|nr:hypothetical protein AV530_018184 [Patagioenas fasciata monilis]